MDDIRESKKNKKEVTDVNAWYEIKGSAGRVLTLMTLLLMGIFIAGIPFTASAENEQTEMVYRLSIEQRSNSTIWVMPEDHVPAGQKSEYEIKRVSVDGHEGEPLTGIERFSLENDGKDPMVFSVTESGERIPYYESYYKPGTYCFGYTLKLHQPAGQTHYEFRNDILVYAREIGRDEEQWMLALDSKESNGEWDSYRLYSPNYIVKERRVIDSLKLRLSPDPAHMYAGEQWNKPELTVEDFTAHGGDAGSESTRPTINLVYHRLSYMLQGGASEEMARGRALPEGNYELELEITDTHSLYRFRWPGTDDDAGETEFWINNQPCTIQRKRQNATGRYDLVLSPVAFHLNKRPEMQEELRFHDSDALDIPETVLGNPILPMDVSPYVTGGTKPYRFTGRGLPEGLRIGEEGIISGTTARAVPAGEAELSVTDQANQRASIIIKYGAVKLRDSGSSGGGRSGGGSSGGGGRMVVPGSSGQYRDLKTGRWIQDHIGWWYRNVDGSYPKAQWGYQQYNGKSYWYYFDERGYMSVGWLDRSGSRYYLYPNSDGWKGRMITGWQWIDGFCYYFETGKQNEGALYLGRQTPDGYTVDAQGRWTVNAVVQKKA